MFKDRYLFKFADTKILIKTNDKRLIDKFTQAIKIMEEM